jgi:Domain of unknown function (DUF222)/HNH endonuclease
MDPNTSSLKDPPGGPGSTPVPARLEGLAAKVAELGADDLDALPDALLAEQVLTMHRLVGQFEAACLRRLDEADARGAAGAETGTRAPSTAAWLRAALRMRQAAAGERVRVARALHRGPLPATAQALAAGEITYQHAAVLAEATHDLPAGNVTEAEPVLLDAARRLDPLRLRRVTGHLRGVIDPDRADERARARLERRGLWLSGTIDGMVAVDGLLDSEAGEAVQAALAPLARPCGPEDERSAAQRRADALGELARLGLQAGWLPQEGGLRPQLTVAVELGSLLAGSGGVGGSGAWGGILAPETVRRLACDAAVTRAMVQRHSHQPGAHHGDGGLAEELRAAVALLPPPLGAPSQLLDLGRTTRVISPALRGALTVRDGGCVAAGCDRPAAWSDAHHLTHWLGGGATSLANLVLLCRTHHRAVHEGGWRLARQPSGQVTLAPPDRHIPRHSHAPPAG